MPHVEDPHVREHTLDPTKKSKILHDQQGVGSKTSEDPEVIEEEEDEEIFPKNNQSTSKGVSAVTTPSFTPFQSHARDNHLIRQSTRDLDQLLKHLEPWVLAKDVL